MHSDAMKASLRQLSCAHCGTTFDCRLGGDCWCADEPYRLPIADAAVEDCLCPACLRTAAARAGVAPERHR